MRTDFFSRSMDVGEHPAYDDLLNRVMGSITAERQMQQYSAPEQIAEVVYEAATDGPGSVALPGRSGCQSDLCSATRARRRTVP
jgi:hypothetical protein